MRKFIERLFSAGAGRRHLRRRLSNRRTAETIKFEHQGHKWFACFSLFEDGEVAEVFLSTARTGELTRCMANDAAIAASLALQYGCPAAVLRAALSRDTGGEPHSPLAAALDLYTGAALASSDGVERQSKPIVQEHKKT